MLRGSQKTTRFGKVTKKGALVTVVKEHYLRDDVPCGFAGCAACMSLIDSGQAVSLDRVCDVLILDTNVLLHQTDLLEALLFGGEDEEMGVVAVLLENVLEEVRHRSTSLHARVSGWLGRQLPDGRRALVIFANLHHRETFIEKKEGETDNAAQDRAIRVATSWYTTHLKSQTCEVRLISDDRENRTLAQRDGLCALSVRAYMSQYYAGKRKLALLSMVYSPSSSLCWPTRRPYTPYISVETAAAGVQRGVYVSGMLLVSPYNVWEGRVVAKWRGTTQTIWIHGRHNLNRAIHGCIVFVQVLPPSRWMRLQDEQLADSGDESDSEPELESVDSFQDQSVEILYDQSNDKLINISGDPSKEALAQTASEQELHDRRISGRIVAVLQQASKHYCGSIEPLDILAMRLDNHDILPDSLKGTCSTSDGIENNSVAGDVALFRPMDPKIPPFLALFALEDAISGVRVLAAIDDWPIGSRFARGHLVRIMGRTGAPNVETACLLFERGITYWQDPWPADVLATLPDAQATSSCTSIMQPTDINNSSIDYSAAVPPPISELSTNNSSSLTTESFLSDENRLDLRHLSVCSIDPPGCTDIDDALHARLLSFDEIQQMVSAGLSQEIQDAKLSLCDEKPIYLEVGVHIADVTHYVAAGTKLDKMAAERGTTVYLCDRRIDMLPEILGSNLCSLMSHVDRPAFTVIWRLAILPGGRLLVLSESFHKSIIRSRSSFTYQQAQDILDAIHALHPQPENNCNLSAIRRTLEIANSNDKSVHGILELLNNQKPEKDSATVWQSSEKDYNQQKLSGTIELAISIYLLNVVAKVRRFARLEAGALTLSSPEVRFDMTPNEWSCGNSKKLPKDSLESATNSFVADSENKDLPSLKLTCKAALETNGLVEECMLMANIAVAHKIHTAYPDLAVLRRHPTPPANNFAELEATLQAADALTRFMNDKTAQSSGKMILDKDHAPVLSWDSSKALAESLERLEAASTPEFASLVRMLVTRCMMQAVYFCAADLTLPDFWHYGLAIPLYTHFTSPIRRYADILVHRLLLAAIQGGGSPWPHCSKKALSEMTAHLNKRHRMAQYASRDSVDFYMTLYYTQQPETCDHAYVIQVYPNGVVLLVPNLGIESPLLFEPASMAHLGITFDPVYRTIRNSAQVALVTIYDLVPVKIVVQEHPKTRAKKVGLQWLTMPDLLRQATQKLTKTPSKRPKNSL